MTDPQTSATGSSYPVQIARGDAVLMQIAEQLYLEFESGLSAEEIASFHEQYQLKPLQRNTGASLRRMRVQSASGDVLQQRSAEICADARIKTARPVYRRADLSSMDNLISFAGEILVRVAPFTEDDEVSTLFASHDLEIVASERFIEAGTLYQVRLRFPKQQDIFKVVDALVRAPIVRSAGPDWLQLNSPFSSNDQFFEQQWNLTQISAPAGWEITEGVGSVIIAVIDSGSDLNHPDLIGKYVPIGDRRDVIHDTNTPDDILGHGTNCAGIAASTTNNTIGIAGVAPGCSIMPIRMFDVEDNGILSELPIVKAIHWAIDHNANVINCSWHFDSADHPNADIALEEAHNANIVIVAASGNCFTNNCMTNSVDYPASHPHVIAVGATDRFDKRQTRTNGFSPPYDSKYGQQLSVMAPGISCPSTTPTSAASKDFGAGYDWTYGTSMAAPHVAGLAALLLSLLRHPIGVPPSMQINDLVRFIIEKTAAKVGGYNYAFDVFHPNGSWNVEMGHGRIDVAAALNYALTHYTVHGVIHWRIVSTILFGLTHGGPGVVLTPHGPVPIDPGWVHLSTAQWDILLGLSVTELAKSVSDPEVRKTIAKAGWSAIEQTAQRVGPDT